MSGPFPEDSAARKTYPLYSGVLQYFPDALAAVAHHSYRGNEKHNPGQPLHWARNKSDDHLDAAARHLVEGDLVGLAWRALAALQLKCEADSAKLSTQTELQVDWIPWFGKASELPGYKGIWVKTRVGRIFYSRVDAVDWQQYNEPDDIVAYGLVGAAE